MKYSAKALIVYLIAMVILVVINETVSIELNTLHLSFCGLFMFGTSVAVHHFTVKASKERPQLFPTYFMAITGLKMMVYIVTLGVYVYIFKDSATPVIITFLTLYVVYTALEVTSALTFLSKKD
ncbi:MAG: di/tricarboxylate transporter [Bacteroidia bacterium]|jgi:di/tricarboxylate transporter